MPIKSSTLQQAESCTCPKKNGAPALHWSHVNPRPGHRIDTETRSKADVCQALFLMTQPGAAILAKPSCK